MSATEVKVDDLEVFDPPDEHGFVARRVLPDGRVLGVFPLIYTHKLVWTRFVGDCGYEDGWCYPTMVEAVIALCGWDGEGDPPDGWIRHPTSGRRRPGGDPTKEHVAP
jgi:hypothetical protein